MKVSKWQDLQGGPKFLVRSKNRDIRGSFEMLFEREKLEMHGVNDFEFKQVNLITSVKNSLRGFHGSNIRNNHWKILTLIKGTITEAFIDLRPMSESFSEIFYKEIRATDNSSLIIPPGFAHAFQTISLDAEIIYATNVEYSKNREFSINPISELSNMIWSEDAIVSDRDRTAPKFSDWLKIHAEL